MWGQRPILTPNLLKDHSNLSKVIQTQECLAFMRHRSLSCFNRFVEPGGQASAVGCSVPTCSQKWELSAHTLTLLLLFVHTVSLSCVHTVCTLFVHRQLVTQPSPHGAVTCGFYVITLTMCYEESPQEKPLLIPVTSQGPDLRCRQPPG